MRSTQRNTVPEAVLPELAFVLFESDQKLMILVTKNINLTSKKEEGLVKLKGKMLKVLVIMMSGKTTVPISLQQLVLQN